jgi:hypothetical protein
MCGLMAASSPSMAVGRIALLAPLVLLFAIGRARAETSTEPSVVLMGNHPADATGMHPVGHADSSAQLNMEVTLTPRNRVALDQLVSDQQNPSSPRYLNGSPPNNSTLASLPQVRTPTPSRNGLDRRDSRLPRSTLKNATSGSPARSRTRNALSGPR